MKSSANYKITIPILVKKFIEAQTLHLGVSFHLEFQVFRLLRSEFLAMAVDHSAEGLVYLLS